jgi:hypothetical protein
MAATLAPGLERRLKAELSGEVRFDRFTRGRYATDASHYQMMPLGVVTPRSVAEAERAIAIARAEKVTVLARGGGTSQSGQTVNHSLVIDCSKYLNRILDLDVAGRRCVVERIARRPQPAAQAPRPLVPGGHLDSVAPPSAWPATILQGAVAALRRHPRQCPFINAVLADGSAAHFSVGAACAIGAGANRVRWRRTCSPSGC